MPDGGTLTDRLRADQGRPRRDSRRRHRRRHSRRRTSRRSSISTSRPSRPAPASACRSSTARFSCTTATSTSSRRPASGTTFVIKMPQARPGRRRRPRRRRCESELTCAGVRELVGEFDECRGPPVDLLESLRAVPRSLARARRWPACAKARAHTEPVPLPVLAPPPPPPRNHRDATSDEPVPTIDRPSPAETALTPPPPRPPARPPAPRPEPPKRRSREPTRIEPRRPADAAAGADAEACAGRGDDRPRRRFARCIEQRVARSEPRQLRRAQRRWPGAVRHGAALHAAGRRGDARAAISRSPASSPTRPRRWPPFSSARSGFELQSLLPGLHWGPTRTEREKFGHWRK